MSLFTRGYSDSRDRMRKNSNFTRSCFNCAYYYQSSGDKEEVCQNTDVLEYDMIGNSSSIYCLKWKPNFEREKKKTIFNKKRGRDRL